MKTFKSFVTEAEDTVTRDKSGKVVSWEHKGDWKKTDNKNPIGKMYNISDIARRRTEKMTKEEIEQMDETWYDVGNTTGGQWRGKNSPSPYKNSNVAKSGARKGMITKSAINRTKEEIKSRLNKEEVDQIDEVAAWQRSEGKNPEGGLNKKGIQSYRREHPGSKLSLAVTTKPSKLKKGSKAWNRRKSFCARMSGMKRRLTSAKTAHDPDSRINKSLRKWNC